MPSSSLKLFFGRCRLPLHPLQASSAGNLAELDPEKAAKLAAKKAEKEAKKVCVSRAV